MSLQSKENLVAKLHDKEYRDALVSSRVSNTLALQVRALREERGWTQKQLAEALGTSQNAVYRLESPRYGKATVTTLKRLASIFDVGLAVWFIPFSKLVDRVTNLSTEDILVPSFDKDTGFRERETATTQKHVDIFIGTGASMTGLLEAKEHTYNRLPSTITRVGTLNYDALIESTLVAGMVDQEVLSVGHMSQGFQFHRATASGSLRPPSRRMAVDNMEKKAS